MASERPNPKLRKVDFDNDLRRLMKIDRASAVQKWMSGGASSGKELKDFFRSRNSFHWAVSGWRGVAKKEIGKLQGWIRFEKDEDTRVDRLINRGACLEGTRVYEISFAKLPGAAPHQMSQAVCLACLKLVKRFKGKVAITAYVSPQNVGSLRILFRAGFAKVGRVKYSHRAKKLDRVLVLGKIRVRPHSN